jgi:hypothetical protein
MNCSCGHRARGILCKNCTNIASLIVCECPHSAAANLLIFIAMNLLVIYLSRGKCSSQIYILHTWPEMNQYSPKDFLDRKPLAQLMNRSMSIVQELYGWIPTKKWLRKQLMQVKFGALEDSAADTPNILDHGYNPGLKRESWIFHCEEGKTNL